MQDNSDKLLYKLILQFAIYNQGTSKQLDPHLVSLTQSLKKGINYHELKPELISLSKTLLHISSTATPTESESELSTDSFQEQYFIARLNKLLENTNPPLKYQNQCAILQQRSKAQLDDNSYKKVVDSAMSLLVNIKNNALHEKQGIESFLAEISSQFGTLEEHADHASKSNEQSSENREHLNTAIELQVDNIQNSTENATELSSLQKNITEYLEELSSQLHRYKDDEDHRQIETKKKLNQLSDQLQNMEVEADSLRNNLKLAHDKALRDPLTGLPNRLAYDERMVVEFSRWKRYQDPLSLIIWDIDLFKLINDNFGHKAGDKTLALVAQLILNNCRDTDFIARFGGEEFIMLLPNTTSEQALISANKIRSIISKSGFNHNGDAITLTISCGISQFLEGDQFETVFERADQALYSSKENGRNQCSILDK